MLLKADNGSKPVPADGLIAGLSFHNFGLGAGYRPAEKISQRSFRSAPFAVAPACRHGCSWYQNDTTDRPWRGNRSTQGRQAIDGIFTGWRSLLPVGPRKAVTLPLLRNLRGGSTRQTNRGNINSRSICAMIA